MSSSNKAVFVKLCKRHYHMLHIASHIRCCLLPRCLSLVFTTLSTRKPKQFLAFGLLLLASALTTPVSAQTTTTTVVNICDRTAEVETAILAAIFSATTCDRVTSDQLAAIDRLDLSSMSIGSLIAGDFAGLSSLTELNLSSNTLSTLPDDIFNGLDSLTELFLSNNSLSALPTSLSDLTSLTELDLEGNDLSTLEADVFSDLTSLIELNLGDNMLSALPAGIFDDLRSLTELNLEDNDLSTLSADVFSDLTGLTELDLEGNDLSTLEADVFSDLTSLTELDLGDNMLSALPAGIFNDLTSLTELALVGNTFTTPLPANLSLPPNLFDPASVSSTDIFIDLSPIGDLTGVALTVGDSTTINVANAFISRADDTGTPRTLSYTLTPANTAIATATESGGVVTITGASMGATTVSVVADDSVSATVTRDIAVTVVGTGILAFDAATGDTLATPIVAEAIGTDTFYVQLASAPASDVTLTLTSSDTNEGTVSPPTLTFTATASAISWDTRQLVTVTAVPDQIDRDDTFMVDFAVTTGDGGAYPTTPDLSSVTVLVTDDDSASIALFDMATGIDAPSITTSEGATTDSFYVALTSQPTSTVTITISGLNTGEHSLTPVSGTLTFTPTGATAWNTRQVITLTGVNDSDIDGNQTYNLTLTPTGGGYTGVTAETVSITNTDDDTAALTVADVSVGENAGTATLTVTLTPAVTAGNVTVDLTTTDGTAEVGEDYTAITSQTLTFTAGSTTQTLDITIDDDNIAEGSETFIVMLDNLMPPTGVTTVSIADATATVTITDDETAPTTITLGGVTPSTVVEAADATPITITATIFGTAVLPTPTFVTVSVGDVSDSATVGTDYAEVTNFDLIIPPGTLSGMATFMIDPTDDGVSDNGETVTISGAAVGFTTVNSTTLTIVETGILVYDAMTAGNQISTVTIVEASGTDTLYVQLASQPATGSSVVIGVTSSDMNEGTVNPPTLTFTNTNWNTRQELTVTAVDDSIDRDDSFMVNFAVTTGDSGNYQTSLTLPSVTVTITDDDTAGIALFDMATGTDEPSITTSEGATTDTFYVVLESEPTDTVTVTISGLVATEHTLTTPASGTLTFTPTGATAWNTRQPITLTGVDDNIVDDDQTYNITLTAMGGGYIAVVIAETIPVTNTDTDTAGLTVADTTVNEDDGTATLTVTLTPAVTAGTVEVDLTTADGTAEASADYSAITSQTLTFMAGSTSETLDITINDDSIAEGGETFTVMLDNLMSPEEVTDDVSITDDTATVTITDDETAPTAINLNISPLTVANTADATEITVTATIEGTAVSPADTTVTVSVGGGTATSGTDYTAVPSFDLTIPALSLSATGTFMIDPNTSSDNGETVMITGTAGGFTVNAATLTIVEAGISVFESQTSTTQISAATITEASSGTFYVELTSPPVTNVVIGITSSDTNEGTVSPATLTFTTTNWDVRQALTVTTVDDNIDRDSGDSFMMDFAITSGDRPNYPTSLTLPSVAVTVTDDDIMSDGIALTVSPDSVTEGAGETVLTVTATLNAGAFAIGETVVEVIVSNVGTALPNTDYTLARISGDITLPTGTITLPTSALTTITIEALETSALGTFAITPIVDDESDAGETLTISGAASINSNTVTVNPTTLAIVEFSREEQQAIEQTVAAQASGITQVVTEQIGIRLASRTSASAQERQSLSSIDWQDRLAKFTYEGLKRLDNEADIMSMDWLLKAAGGDGQLIVPLGVESLTLWATGGHLKTKGDGMAAYDGDVNSVILGIDTALSNDWLAGVAVSYNDSEVDYTMEGIPEAKTEQSLYAVHPYLSYTLSQGLTLWGTAGYGFGDVDFSDIRYGQATSDVTQWMAAGGVEKQIITNTPWQVALRVKGLWGNATVDATKYSGGAPIARVDTDFWRARMESELGYNFSLPGGNIRPYALIGGRWDHNDAVVSGDEWHLDVGGGVEVLSANVFALNISARTQVTDGDTEEDSIVGTGSLTYDFGYDRQGLQIALSRPLDNTSPAWDQHSFNEVTNTASGINSTPLTSELAYGWTVRPFGLEGALQTYVQNSFDSDDRRYAVGLELAVNALTLNFETGYHDHTSLDSGETDGSGLESMLKTKIRW